MGRRAEGWKVDWRAGWAHVHFTWQGKLYREALGTRDAEEAAKAAARAYAETVSGRRRSVAARPSKRLELGELIVEWIEAQHGSLAPKTCKTLETYGRHWIAFFESFDHITEARAGDYGRNRLRLVIRRTVLKELSFLRMFLEWCVEQRALAVAPVVPKIKKRAPGTRSGRQRAVPVKITQGEAEQIIALLPVESKRIKGRTWPLRARFAFTWETALRPATIAVLSVPKHWSHGAEELILADADDKARYGRHVDLTPAAKRALTEAYELLPEGTGILFGPSQFYVTLKAAATVVLGPDKGKDFAPYDFRHGRARHILSTGGSLRGAAYVLGHKHLSTTDKYLDGNRDEGREALGLSTQFLHNAQKPSAKEGT